MRLILLLVALAAAIQTTQAQTSATVYVQPSSGANSYNGQMSTSFVGLKLPSGGGTVSITVSPGDYADQSYVTSYADQTQAGPYIVTGSSTSFTIGTAGHYWFYLSANAVGTPSNYDWVEIRVVASTFSGTISCTYCSPPSGWGSGWPPYGTPLLSGPASESAWPVSQPATPSSTSSSSLRIPTWVIPILAIVIAAAVLVPTSYLVYRCVQNKKKAQLQAQAGYGNNNNHTIDMVKTTQYGTKSQVELQTVTAV